MFVCVCVCLCHPCIQVWANKAPFGLAVCLQQGVKLYESISPDKQKVCVKLFAPFGRVSEVLYPGHCGGYKWAGRGGNDIHPRRFASGCALQENPESFYLHFLRDDIRLDIIYLIYLLFFSPPADNRPSGKSPVGTVQEPPSKLPGEKTLASYFL